MNGGVIGDITCSGYLESTGVQYISENTPLIRSLSQEDTTKDDWLYIIIMDIVSLYDMIICVTCSVVCICIADFCSCISFYISCIALVCYEILCLYTLKCAVTFSVLNFSCIKY